MLNLYKYWSKLTSTNDIREKCKITASLTFKGMNWIALVDGLKPLMIELCMKLYCFKFAFSHVPLSISFLTKWSIRRTIQLVSTLLFQFFWLNKI